MAAASVIRRSSASLAFLIAAILLFPLFTLHSVAIAAKCSPGHVCPTPTSIDVPECGTHPGLADPPVPPRPLDALAAPIGKATPVGTLPGNGEVTPTGEYRYRIPIDVPAGRAGMQPSLALVYASRGKSGHLGVAWQFEGLSSIDRCPKTIATEGYAEGIHLSEDDAYCLDGHKLVAIQGAHGGNGTEYRTEDELFARIISYTSGDHLHHFRVWTRDGRIRTYERILGEGDGGWMNAGYAFPLAEEADRAGNAVRYTYRTYTPAAPLGQNEYVPDQITYTFQNTKSPPEPGRRSVRFVYEDRPDHGEALVAHRFTATTVRLKAIELVAPTLEAPDNPSLAWRYDLSYVPSTATGRSLLKSIKRCGGLGGCLPARVFDWEQAKGPTYAAELIAGSPSSPRQIVADLDGDGRQELVLLYEKGVRVRTTVDPAHPLALSRDVDALLQGKFEIDKALPLDLNGDGRDEVLMRDGTSRGYYAFFLEPGIPLTGAQQPILWGLPMLDSSTLDSLTADVLFPIDLNGDGLPDLVQGNDDPNASTWTSWTWGYRLGVKSLAFAGPLQTVYTAAPGPLPGGNAFPVDQGDFRGTIFLGTTSPLSPYMPPDTKMFGFSVGPNGPVDETYELLRGEHRAFADMNGDGRREGVSLEVLDEHVCIHGEGQWDCAALDDLVSPSELQNTALKVADLDGDGADELLLVPPGEPARVLRVRLTADWQFEVADLGVPRPDAIGDFNGDGLLDLASFALEGWTVHRQTGSGTVDRVRAVLDEGGAVAREEVVYAQAWSPDLDPVTCSFPQRCMRHGFGVVREHRVDQGSALAAGEERKQRVLYNYEDPRFDLHGRGFLGFGTVRRWESGRKAETITTYDHETAIGGVYPNALKPKQIQRAVPIQASGAAGRARIEQVSFSYQFEQLHEGKTYFVRPSSFTSLEWEEDVAVDASDGAKVHLNGIDGADMRTALRARQGSYTYDAYANLIETTVHTRDGVETTVHATYDNWADDWLIGLRRTETVTSTEPDAAAPPLPRRREYTYDARGFLCHVFIENYFPDTSIPEALTFSYDAEGLVRAVTDSAVGEPDRITHIAYEPTERVYRAQVWNDLGHTEAFLYHPALGTLLASEDANAVISRYGYDDLGRIRKAVPEGNGAIDVAYAPRVGGGVRVTTTEQAGGVAWTDYDELGRAVGQGHNGFDGTPIAQATRYDSLGRLVSVSRPGFHAPSSHETTYTFDNLDRLTREHRIEGDVTLEHTFFATTTTDPVGRKQRVTRDLDGRAVESAVLKGGKAIATTYHYQSFGLVDRIRDPKDNTIVLGYDQRGRRTLLDDPDAGTSEVQYNGFGDATQVIRDGTLTRSFFDKLGRVWKVESGDGTATTEWDKSPHGLGRLSSATSADGVTTAFAYDTFGRLATETWTIDGDAFVVDRKYDPLGRLSKLTYPDVPGHDSFAVAYSYAKGSGYLEDVHDATTLASYWHVEGRNSDDQLTRARLGNGITSERFYDDATGRLTELHEGPALSLRYDYRADGRVYHRFDDHARRQETFGYDTFARLERWKLSAWIQGPPGSPSPTLPIRTTRYGYDDIGNLTQVFADEVLQEENVYAENGRPHALTSNGQGTYFYDARGRQEDAPGRTVVFNELDLPKTISTAAGLTSFSYDASGARVKKSGPSGTVVSVAGLYERREQGGSVQHVFYVHGSEGLTAQVVVPETGNGGGTTYLHTDALGSVGAVTDASGKVLDRMYYEPFGRRRDENGSPATSAPSDVLLGFTGQRHDDDLGLIDYRGRIYDPVIRRFVTPDAHVTDPLDSQSYNRYSYVRNDPTNLTDPTGFDWWDGSLGCIGLECVGAGFFSVGGTFDIGGFAVVLGHANTTAGSGSSAPRYASGGPVMGSEQRPVSVPTGPSAPAMAAAGPEPQAWAGAGGEGEDEEEGSWRDSPLVRGVGGLFVGLGFGVTPGGGIADQFLSTARVLNKGTRASQVGKALGEMLGGAWLTLGGIGGGLVGTGLSTTGVGALLGVPAMAVSAGLVTSGIGNMAAGLQGLGQALQMNGSGGSEKAAGSGHRVPDRVQGQLDSEQQALVDMAKTDSKRIPRGQGPVTARDADSYIELASKAGVPVRAKPGDLSGGHGYGPVPPGPNAAHIHINGEHVPVPPGYRPPHGSKVIE